MHLCCQAAATSRSQQSYPSLQLCCLAQPKLANGNASCKFHLVHINVLVQVHDIPVCRASIAADYSFGEDCCTRFEQAEACHAAMMWPEPHNSKFEAADRMQKAMRRWLLQGSLSLTQVEARYSLALRVDLAEHLVLSHHLQAIQVQIVQQHRDLVPAGNDSCCAVC